MIYVIADLHLGFSQGKTMDPFGVHWERHYEKIRTDWMERVREEDLVVIAGDISWAMSIEEALPDLSFIMNLPGQKLLIKGNHDYWWSSIAKLKSFFCDERLHFLQNDCFVYGEVTICGTRGWNCPGSSGFTKDDLKINNREVERLKLSLQKADKSREIVVVMHYPPMNEALEPSGFTQLIKEYGVKRVFYGHVHGSDNFIHAPNGCIQDVYYQLISADFLDFKLIDI